jgi:hypothetical protein
MSKSARSLASDDVHFAELDLVRLRHDTADGDILFKEDTVGTVVYCHEQGEAFEVEFATPVAAVLTLGPLDILPVADAA